MNPSPDTATQSRSHLPTQLGQRGPVGEPAPARMASGANAHPTGCPGPAVLWSVPFHLSDVPPLPGLDRLQHPAQKHLKSDRPRGPSRQPVPVPVTFSGAPSSFRAFSRNGIPPGAGALGSPPGAARTRAPRRAERALVDTPVSLFALASRKFGVACQFYM